MSYLSIDACFPLPINYTLINSFVKDPLYRLIILKLAELMCLTNKVFDY